MKRKKKKQKEKAEREVCVVLMPFDRNFNNQWQLAIKPAIEKMGLLPLRADQKVMPADVFKGVAQCIYIARLLIADVSDGNPNVMYELGLAQAIGKRVIIVTQSPGDIPRDLQGHRYLEYDVDNIAKFKQELENNISEILEAGAASKEERIFLELEIMDIETKSELSYLRKKAARVEVDTYPPTADIFFNDKLLGTSPQTILVNPDAPMNTISATNVLFFEEHRELTKEEIEKGHATIILEGLADEVESKKIPEYIRWNHKTPYNPAIMRAISHYLLYIKAYDEAHNEAIELVETAPEWYLAHNQAGHVATRQGSIDEAIECFDIVRSMRPDNVIGYYNLSCVYSIKGEFEKCIENLEKIFDEPARVETYGYLSYNIVVKDDDFDNIRRDRNYKQKFEYWERKLTEIWEACEGQRNKVREQVRKKGTHRGRKRQGR